MKVGEPLEFFNPEEPYNNVVHERDIATLIASVLKRGLSGSKMIVVGSAGRTTIERVVGLLAEATKTRSRISVVQARRVAFLVDSSKAVREFGYAPMDVEDSLRQFVEDNLTDR